MHVGNDYLFNYNEFRPLGSLVLSLTIWISGVAGVVKNRSHISPPLYRPAKEVWSHHWACGLTLTIASCSPVIKSPRRISGVSGIFKLWSLS